MKFFLLVTIAMALCYSETTSAASFQCSKANGAVERLICSEQELSQLDETLADAYRYLLETIDKSEIKEQRQAQLKWIKERNQCIRVYKPVDCISLSYRRQIRHLETWFSSVSWANHKLETEWKAFQARMSLHKEISQHKHLGVKAQTLLHAEIERLRAKTETCADDSRDWSCASHELRAYKLASLCLKENNEPGDCLVVPKKMMAEKWQPWLLKGEPISPNCFIRSNYTSVFDALKDHYDNIGRAELDEKVLTDASALYKTKSTLPPAKNKSGEPLYYRLADCKTGKSKFSPTVSRWKIEQRFCEEEGDTCETPLTSTYKSIQDPSFLCRDLILPSGATCIDVRRTFFIDEVNGTKRDDRFDGYYGLVHTSTSYIFLWLGEDPVRRH